jgi:hypothetical protein
VAFAETTGFFGATAVALPEGRLILVTVRVMAFGVGFFGIELLI